MAFSFLSFLPRAIRQLAPAIKGAIYRGLSRPSIRQLVARVSKIKIAPQQLSRLADRITAVKQHGRVLQRLEPGDIPNVNALPEAISKIRDRMSFTVSVRGFHRMTGELQERFVTIAMSTAIPRASIERMARSMIEAEGERYEIVFVSSQIIDGVREGQPGRL